MVITLERPLIALDVETHANVPPEDARICEIGFYMVYHDGRPPREWVSFVNPELLIDPETEKIHGISNAQVSRAPRFKQLAPSFAKGFRDCDYCGYNVNYDVRVLRAEMLRAGQPWSIGDARLLDPFRLWRLAEPRTLTDAVRRFLGREPSQAHRALDDARDAYEIAVAQLDAFPQLPRDLQQLHDQCFEKERHFVDPDGKFLWTADGEVQFNFGKHGRSKTLLKAAPRSYLVWMYRGDFSAEIKHLLGEALQGRFPHRATHPVPDAPTDVPAELSTPDAPPRVQTSLFD